MLFVCSRNLWRSPTAEAIYKNRQGITAKSAGTEPSAKTKVNAKLIEWADVVFAMEKKHKQRLVQKFPLETSHKKIVVLEIPDDYRYMDEELIESITTSVSPYLKGL
nr:protein tyrosine phosphatase [Algoriphagus oliviformis]